MERSTTASAIIRFAEDLENAASDFYTKAAQQYTENKETFLAFAKESKKNRVQVTRTYQETITDALEACFSFEGLDLSDYTVDTKTPEDISHSDLLKKAIELEKTATKFYSHVADLSTSLLATIPRTLRKVAEKRNRRKPILESLLEKTTA